MITVDSDGSSTISNTLYASFGVMGGFMQPQGHMQVVLSLVDDGLDPQAALDQPRFCIDDGTAGGQVALEEGIPLEVQAELGKTGTHVVFGQRICRVQPLGVGRSSTGMPARVSCAAAATHAPMAVP